MQLELERQSNSGRSLLAPTTQQLAPLPAGPPLLIVAIDTEAEFDWAGPFRRDHTGVRNIAHQAKAQAIFARFGVRPIYLVDYAVATQAEGYGPLKELAQSGQCEIGAHLHPWITPPFLEELGNQASFSHNLPMDLQTEKLATLTDAIESNFHYRPISYRAGRYGVGEDAAAVLSSLDYRIDMSVQPGVDMRGIYGPNFQDTFDQPYWFGSNLSLLEIPATPAFAGFLAEWMSKDLVGLLYHQISRPLLNKFKSQGFFSRLNLLDRLHLSPEGATLEELRRLTSTSLLRGSRVFVMSYHSPSLLPGNTEYVRSAKDLERFLNVIEGYLEYFMNDVGGRSTTPSELLDSFLGTATGQHDLSATHID